MAKKDADGFDDEFRAVLRELNESLDHMLVPLLDLAEGLTTAIDPTRIGALVEADLAPLIPQMHADLQQADDFLGMGFVAASGVMRDQDRYVLFYQRGENSLRRLSPILSGSGPELYDYFDTDWFRETERRRAPAIHGPYVDYAGSDFLVLTAAAPVIVDGRFVGVAAADLYPDRIESALVRMLRGLPADAVVFASDRSILAANSVRWMPGERMAVHPTMDRRSWQAVGALTTWTGWTLALARPEVD